jgi:Mrp family chromosome partitioning ATPase
MLITSSVPDEGKTTAVINLGLAMSQTNGKVLVIDVTCVIHVCMRFWVSTIKRGLSEILSSDLRQLDIHAMN